MRPQDGIANSKQHEPPHLFALVRNQNPKSVVTLNAMDILIDQKCDSMQGWLPKQSPGSQI
jgi:hypothetical protein